MTHGDKAKAKTGKSSQASAAKKSSSPVKEAAGKAVQGKGGGKAAPQESASKAGAQGKTGKISIKKAGAEKGSPSPAVEKAAASSGKEGGGAKAKARVEDASGFSNPAIANAFKHAVKKYPNAFRKLTD